MNSRERILAAINHKIPDHVPIDLGSTPSSGISAVAYQNLKKYLGITSGYTRVYDVIQQLAQPEDEIIERFEVDVLDIGRLFNQNSENWYDFKLHNDTVVQFPKWFQPKPNEDGSYEVLHQDGTSIAKMSSKGFVFDQVNYPYLYGYPNDFSNISEDMGKVSWALKYKTNNNYWAILKQNAIKLRKNTDKALVVGSGCKLFEWTTYLRRMDKLLVDLIRDRNNVEKLTEAIFNKQIINLEKVCESVGDIVDIIRFTDDLGENNGPFMSPKLYRKFFKPYHTEWCSYVHKNSSAKTFIHCCGSIIPIIPDLIEAGFDILNPVQINAYDMDPQKLKENFGKEITFWGGGADTRFVLNNKNPIEVKKHVLNLLEIFAPGGGYVFTPIHNILPDVPPGNIIAMYEAVKEFNVK